MNRPKGEKKSSEGRGEARNDPPAEKVKYSRITTWLRHMKPLMYDHVPCPPYVFFIQVFMGVWTSRLVVSLHGLTRTTLETTRASCWPSPPFDMRVRYPPGWKGMLKMT